MEIVESQAFFLSRPASDTTDGSAFSRGDEDGLTIRNCSFKGENLSENLKFSQCRNVTVEDCVIESGYEDCLDICRGANYVFRRCKFVRNTPGRTHVTFKGGANHALFEECTFTGKVAEASIDLGNWSNYDIVDRPKVTSVKIVRCTFDNVGPIRVRTIWAERPVFINCTTLGKSRDSYWGPVWVWGFWIGRRLWQKCFETRPDAAQLVIQPWERV